MQVSNRLNQINENSGARMVRKFAQRMLREYGKIEPPFMPEDYCKMRNIEASKVTLKDCDARLIPMGKGYLAEVCAEHPQERQNFSLCHEVGHTFFVPDATSLGAETVDCSISFMSEARMEERLCNIAAAELLMPEKQFRAIVSDYTPSLTAIRDIAKVFNTSAQATAARLVDLDVWPCMYTCLQPIDTDCLEIGFNVKWWKASASAFKGYLSSDIVIYCLQHMAKSTNALKNLGIYQALANGVQTEAEFTIEPLGKSLLLQSFKFYRYGKPSVFSIFVRSKYNLQPTLWAF